MITLNTLNTLIDDILLIARNSNIVESENINRLQIKQWINTYRAMLLKQDIDKDGDVNPDYVQTIGPKSLDVVEYNPNANFCKLKVSEKIPRTIDLNRKYGMFSITDSFGNPIQIGDAVKSNKQKYRRFTCNDYIAFLQNGYWNISGPNLITDVYFTGIYEDPDAVDSANSECPDDDKLYPLPFDKLPVLKELILKRELGIMIGMPSDDINNRQNDLLNAAARAKS